MNVVAYAGAVMGRVVVTKHLKLGQPANGHLGDIRHQVVGNAVRIFADAPRGMRPHRIEIAQQRDMPLRISRRNVTQDVFEHPLGAPIGVGGPGGEIFTYGYRRRVTINGRRRAEYDPLHPRPGHHLGQRQGTAHIVVVVGHRLADRLSDRLEPGKMNDRVNGMLRKNLCKPGPITDIGLITSRQPLSRDFLHPVQCDRLAVAVVVEHNHLMTGCQQFYAGMRANVAGTARHKYTCHGTFHSVTSGFPDDSAPDPQSLRQ